MFDYVRPAHQIVGFQVYDGTTPITALYDPKWFSRLSTLSVHLRKSRPDAHVRRIVRDPATYTLVAEGWNGNLYGWGGPGHWFPAALSRDAAPVETAPPTGEFDPNGGPPEALAGYPEAAFEGSTGAVRRGDFHRREAKAFEQLQQLEGTRTGRFSSEKPLVELLAKAAPPVRPSETEDAAERKAMPVFSGVLRYFPDALCEVARVSKTGNDQHNPGQPLYWAKHKSQDEGDALTRHLLKAGSLDTDGMRHSAKLAWRALALLQREIDAEHGEEY